MPRNDLRNCVAGVAHCLLSLQVAESEPCKVEALMKTGRGFGQEMTCEKELGGGLSLLTLWLSLRLRETKAFLEVENSSKNEREDASDGALVQRNAGSHDVR